MARRASVPTAETTATATPSTATSKAADKALAPQTAAPRPNDAPPTGVAKDEPLPIARVLELLDRLAGADEAAFVQTWLESLLPSLGATTPPLGRSAAEPRRRLDPAFAVRLLRACRETGRLDRARELSSDLPANPNHWPPVETARLSIERAMLATLDGRATEADEARTQAARALGAAASGAGLREQLDLHLVGAELELRRSDLPAAARSLRLAEHVAERLDDGAFRVAVSMSLGHLAMRLADPRGAAKHYKEALDRAPSRGNAAMRAHGNVAIALASTGSFDAAQKHAEAACATAASLDAGWRHADAFDVLAIVAIAADRAADAIVALDAAFAILGEQEQPTLRYQLSSHKTFALAAGGKAAQAKTWLAKTERLKTEIGHVDAIDAQDLVATRARTLEATGAFEAALECGLGHAEALPQAFVTGTLNLVLGRAALALGKADIASACLERAALSGEMHGWVFPERQASLSLYALGRRSGDSRVVRYVERMLGPAEGGSTTDGARAAGDPKTVYLTTRDGVSIGLPDTLREAIGAADMVVDTLSHELRVGKKTSSLERRRALEPLVVGFLRRAKEGLSAEEILRAAGGPGPDSADAEHRVRVLVSRVRDLLGDPALIVRLRDAGAHGKTRYRLADGVRFALVEPQAP